MIYVKTFWSVFFFWVVVLISASCSNTENPVVGNWKIEAVAPDDSLETDGYLLAFAVLTMLADDEPFVFEKDGSFTIGSGSEQTKGTYELTAQSDTVVLTDYEGMVLSYKIEIVDKDQLKLSSESGMFMLKK